MIVPYGRPPSVNGLSCRPKRSPSQLSNTLRCSAVGNSSQFAGIFQTNTRPCDNNINDVSAVSALLSASCPSAITWFISFIVVDPFYRMFRAGARPQIFKKAFKWVRAAFADAPSVAHPYSSSAIILELRSGLVRAPSLHFSPNKVFWIRRERMPLTVARFLESATAAYSGTFEQRRHKRPAHSSAVATALNTLLISLRADYCEIAVSGFKRNWHVPHCIIMPRRASDK